MTQILHSAYINGQWLDNLLNDQSITLINPATEETYAQLPPATGVQLDAAVASAQAAFTEFSQSGLGDRLELLQCLNEQFQHRREDIAQAMTLEMGAPIKFSRAGQAGCGTGHFKAAHQALAQFQFHQLAHGQTLVREAIGVCGLITPWNWPVNQIACKIAPAFACGCPVVLKASELSSLSAQLFAEVIGAAIAEVGLDPGIFNLVQGSGPDLGRALAAHSGIDMVSFTGSTQAGRDVAVQASASIKRVCQELGGKSPYIVASPCNIEVAVTDCCKHLFLNTGQSCNAPSRLLVPRNRLAQAEAAALTFCQSLVIGSPQEEATRMGPLVSQRQWQRVQDLIQAGLDEGAKLIAGGPGRPDHLEKGFYTQATVFSNVENSMNIAREEIFGPVLCIIAYDTIKQAVEIANDTPYGLAAYIGCDNLNLANATAKKLRAGMIHINGADNDFALPFGGYKQSGNGREWGQLGFEEYLETKVIMTRQ